MKIISNFLAILFCLSMGTAYAQESNVQMADSMRAEGKIYVVVAIILAILFGFIVYLFLLDRKISMLEKQILKNPPKSQE